MSFAIPWTSPSATRFQRGWRRAMKTESVARFTAAAATTTTKTTAGPAPPKTEAVRGARSGKSRT